MLKNNIGRFAYVTVPSSLNDVFCRAKRMISYHSYILSAWLSEFNYQHCLKSIAAIKMFMYLGCFLAELFKFCLKFVWIVLSTQLFTFIINRFQSYDKIYSRTIKISLPPLRFYCLSVGYINRSVWYLRHLLPCFATAQNNRKVV
jgi:hypothetical protein